MSAQTDDLLTTLDQKAAPGTAAVLVVDVQNDFVAEGGFFHRIGADIGRIQQSVAPLSRLLAAAREAGVLVVFVQAIYDPPPFVGGHARAQPAPRRRHAPLHHGHLGR